ncbi:hypothetical protein LZ32DRAFT_661183 [Colletotrichum eremochloae]|nr:hypothetical protein LZ32DRAFT_661183 [Colletotrichum eremochloae]
MSLLWTDTDNKQCSATQELSLSPNMPYRITLYINGAEVDYEIDDSLRDDLDPSIVQLTLGGRNTKDSSSEPTSSFSGGQITGVRLWRSERTAEDITDNILKSIIEPGEELIAYQPMEFIS